MQLQSVDGSVICSSGPERPTSGIIALHGLGESRSGINYLFAYLQRELSNTAVVVCFDLPGLGESVLPLDLGRWPRTTTAIAGWLLTQGVKTIHLLARGLGTAAIPGDWPHGQSLALTPFRPELNMTEHVTHHTPMSNEAYEPIDNGCFACRQFWLQCGIEVPIIGGTRLPLNFFNQLTTVRRVESHIDHVFHDDALLQLESSRRVLLEIITKVLNAE